MVTEEDFVKNDKWLINDIEKKNKLNENSRKSNSKRKFNSSSESLENQELENESSRRAKKNAQKSKKRFTVTEEDENTNESNMMQCEKDTNNVNLYFDENLFEQDTNSNQAKSTHLDTVSETLSDIYIADVDEDFEMIEHRRQAHRTSSHSNYLKNSTNERKSLKNVSIKKAFGKLNSDVSNQMPAAKVKEVKPVDSFKIFDECRQSKPMAKQPSESKPTSNKLKLKVLIDNKSLLIPIS